MAAESAPQLDAPPFRVGRGIREGFMPPWPRNLIVALLTGLCTGCGSGGLFWVDDKLSKLSAPPKADLARTNSGWKDVPASRPTSVAAVSKAPISTPRDDEDGTL